MFKRFNLMAFIAALFAMFSNVAVAAVDAAVTTELSTAKTDVMTVGAAVFAIAIAIVIFKWFRRAL